MKFLIDLIFLKFTLGGDFSSLDGSGSFAIISGSFWGSKSMASGLSPYNHWSSFSISSAMFALTVYAESKKKLAKT